MRFVLFFMEHVHMYCTICCFCRPSQEVLLQCFGVCAPDACKKLLICRQKRFGKSFACQRSDWQLTERLIDKGSQISNAYTMHLAQVFFEQKQKALSISIFLPTSNGTTKNGQHKHISNIDHWSSKVWFKKLRWKYEQLHDKRRPIVVHFSFIPKQITTLSVYVFLHVVRQSF